MKHPRPLRPTPQHRPSILAAGHVVDGAARLVRPRELVVAGDGVVLDPASARAATRRDPLETTSDAPEIARAVEAARVPAHLGAAIADLGHVVVAPSDAVVDRAPPRAAARRGHDEAAVGTLEPLRPFDPARVGSRLETPVSCPGERVVADRRGAETGAPLRASTRDRDERRADAVERARPGDAHELSLGVALRARRRGGPASGDGHGERDERSKDTA